MTYPLPAGAGFIWYRHSLTSPAMLEAVQRAIAKWLAWHLR